MSFYDKVKHKVRATLRAAKDRLLKPSDKYAGPQGLPEWVKPGVKVRNIDLPGLPPNRFGVIKQEGVLGGNWIYVVKVADSKVGLGLESLDHIERLRTRSNKRNRRVAR